MIILTNMNVNDIIGILGVALILIAYFLSSFKLMDGQGSLYYWMNAVGAALACLASYLIAYWPFVVLEGTWMIVSVVALVRRPLSRGMNQSQE